jgi:hypothetical protein
MNYHVFFGLPGADPNNPAIQPLPREFPSVRAALDHALHCLSVAKQADATQVAWIKGNDGSIAMTIADVARAYELKQKGLPYPY